jgi:hypothetical protein
MRNAAEVLRRRSAARFGLVLAPYNVLSALLTQEDLLSTLTGAALVAAPDAAFAFDVIIAEALPWSQPPYHWESNRSIDGDVVVHQAGRFNPATRRHEIVQEFYLPNGVVHVEHISQRHWQTCELRKAFDSCGWCLHEREIIGTERSTYVGVARKA